MASISQLTARLVDLFGSPATANPAKLAGNLTVSPNGNVLVGTATDDGVNKLQVTGPSKITGNTAVTGTHTAGALSVTGTSTLSTTNVTGTVTVTGNASVYGSGVYSGTLFFNANGYAPFMRSNSTAGTLEMVNSANTALNFSMTDAGVLNLPRARPTWAGVTPWDTGNLNHPCYSNSGNNMAFNWSGQGGQPTWIWGGNDGVNMYVYNPSNWSVNYAASANYATTAGSVGGISTPCKAYGNAHTLQWDGGSGNINFTVDSTFIAYLHQNVSDVRLKENIAPNKLDSLAMIDQIDFKEYDFKDSGRHVNTGVIAQEVEQFAPDWIHTADNGQFTDAKFLHTHNMLLSALHAIQQLSAEVKTLKAQLKEKE